MSPFYDIIFGIVLGGQFILTRLVGIDKVYQLIWTGDMSDAKVAIKASKKKKSIYKEV